MIDIFESSVRINPDQVFFAFVDSNGFEISYTYRQARLISAALARRLAALGVRAGEIVVADLPNCPEYVFTVLACAYGDFVLTTLNHALTPSEKLSRVLELERYGNRVALQIDIERAHQLMPKVRMPGLEDSSIIASIVGRPNRERAIMGEKQDIVHDTVHFAERAAHLFSGANGPGVIFASGRPGRAKLVPLKWKQLVDASLAANELFAESSQEAWQAKLPLGQSGQIPRGAVRRPQVVWQCALPLSNIDGFQVMVRSVAGLSPFRLYADFDAERVLQDGETCGATHICVREEMLQDLLTVEEWRCELLSGAVSRMSCYQCILLCNRTLDARTLKRAVEIGARMFASYGMTETSGLVAASLVNSDFRGGLRVCPGMEVRIVKSNENGFGNLALRGPGVFDGYTNANAAFTVDRYLITGDTAAFCDGKIYVKSRTADMFVSGGENIYPSEIAESIRHVPGVKSAHVFGIEDAALGSVPVAIVELSDASLTSEQIMQTVKPWLSGRSIPQSILVVDRLPRTETGKVDRASAEALYRNRLQVKRIVLHHIKLPFTRSYQTATASHHSRESVIIEVVDSAGRVGLGECAALGPDWGYAETLPEDTLYIKDVLAPALLQKPFMHPREATPFFTQFDGAAQHPMAVAALENALWDLYGQVMNRPLWQLMNEEYERIWANMGLSAQYKVLPRVVQTDGAQAMVAAGAVIGMMPTPAMMQAVSDAVAAGYRRVKINVAPGASFSVVQAVRKAYPGLLITIDASRSFSSATSETISELRAYDRLNIGWIEEPFDVSSASTQLRRDHAANLANMQPQLATPLCADESYQNAAEAEHLLDFPDIRCIAIKPAKFGGIEPTLAFMARAKAQGRFVWMAGMHETGISRRVNAAFETLPDMVIPGDIDSTLRFFTTDITTPPYGVTRGLVLLNGEGRERGLGCSLNQASMSEVTQHSMVIE